jgi:NADH:ubiquinone oxidoreductase subunit E
MSSDQVDIEICLGPECRGHGGSELLSGLKQQGIEAKRGHCRGLCIYMPVAHVDSRCIPEASVEAVTSEIGDDQQI